MVLPPFNIIPRYQTALWRLASCCQVDLISMLMSFARSWTNGTHAIGVAAMQAYPGTCKLYMTIFGSLGCFRSY